MPRVAKPWFRVYAEIADNPKFHELPDKLAKPWMILMALASVTEPRGHLPSIHTIAFKLRVKEDKAKDIVAALVERRFIEPVNQHYELHDWNDWQYESDANLTPGRAVKTERGRYEERPAVESPPNHGGSAAVAREYDGAETEQIRDRADPETETETEEGSPRKTRRRPLSQVEAELPRLQDDYPSLNVADEFTSWNLYLKSKGKTYLDYVAAFETWLRNEVKYAKQRTSTPRGTAANASDRAAAILAGHR